LFVIEEICGSLVSFCSFPKQTKAGCHDSSQFTGKIEIKNVVPLAKMFKFYSFKQFS